MLVMFMSFGIVIHRVFVIVIVINIVIIVVVLVIIFRYSGASIETRPTTKTAIPKASIA